MPKMFFVHLNEVEEIDYSLELKQLTEIDVVKILLSNASSLF